MILFNCSCGLRHKFTYPCDGVIDINSMDEVEDNKDDEKDIEEEKDGRYR